jgi:peroxiredoxin
LPSLERPLILVIVYFRVLVPALVAAGLLACDQPSVDAGASPPGQAAPARELSAPPPKPESNPKASSKYTRKERPLPAFSGWTLDDEKLAISSLIGKRLVIFFFTPGVEEAPIVAEAVTNLTGFRGKYNFEIVGIAAGSDRETARKFAQQQGLDFPVIDDSSAAIARRLGLGVPIAILGVDAEGYFTFGLGQFPTTGPDGVKVAEDALRTSLRLPALAKESVPEFGTRPVAPTFSGDVLDGDEPFDLAAQRGRPVVLIFFLYTCPHCHEAMASMKKILAEMPENQRPVLVGVEATGRTAVVREKLANLGLDFFPVLFDRDGDIRNLYGVFGSVPDIFLIDAQGHIAARIEGWREETDLPLLRMRLAQLAGVEVPLLLRSKGYSGNDNCGVCHESEHTTWMLTRHAQAFNTLVKHGEASDPECVGCHVVGYEEPGGFEGAIETPYLEHVGCETCHGRGGPHLSPDLVEDGDYAPVCVSCHDAKHSLGFDYATFLPRVSHEANEHLLSLPLEEKRKRLEQLGVRRSNLLPNTAEIVGSDACESCHEKEFATWLKSGHAHAGATLLSAKEGFDAGCLKCHTTAIGREGGFPSDGALETHLDLGRVGCESCHGPGGDHVGEEAPRIGTIVSLGDKCHSCVVLKLCGGCHDEANDPGFEFSIQERIEKQRHGTIEPGTGEPKDASALLFRRPPGAAEGLDAAAHALNERG